MKLGGRRVGDVFAGVSVREEDVGDGITMFRLSTRATRAIGIDVSPYLVGCTLVDTGFGHVRRAVCEALASRRLEAIALTHHHEDHAANAAALARACGCPVFLRHPDLLWSEGVDRPLPYRHMWWGPIEPYQPLEMPQTIETGGRILRAIPTPGHSGTHTAFFEEKTGVVFSGDLYTSPGVAAVMPQELPDELVRSLRLLADLGPSRILTGHARILTDPAPRLRRKADVIEEAVGRVIDLSSRGLDEGRIVDHIFADGRSKDLLFRLVTFGEFSRVNFVRACLRQNEAARRT
jgi:glyoxylase-like metal-dependent hydrolase (beta-lactamase superfamily II)